MFLRQDGYFHEPNKDAVIKLYNGTFTKSENVITRDRMVDVSLVGNGQRIAVDTSQWYEKDSITYLRLNTGAEGTKLVGVSTAPRHIALPAKDFNSYLEHDGVMDMLQWRTENNALDQDAVERYSKHVKTIFQVGNALSDDWKTVLGYPIEFVPLENPYDIHSGHALQVKLLLDGKPLSNQLVYVGHESTGNGDGKNTEHTHEDGTTHSHDTGKTADDHQHSDVKKLRTDENGLISIDINSTGVWYLRTIHLAHLEEEGLTHESNWATLTFAVGQGHSHEHAQEAHHHEEGVPSYWYWIGSLLLVMGLFFWFNRKK
jgi:hypothetical protein